ncbi:disease resistance protein, partial [Trifolium medium]|nr:disease resistance protein [Trifolium medium]
NYWPVMHNPRYHLSFLVRRDVIELPTCFTCIPCVFAVCSRFTNSMNIACEINGIGAMKSARGMNGHCGMNNARVMLSEGMDEMKLSTHSELQEAWHDGHGLQNNLFYNLTKLKLVNCDITPYAIPSNILPCLKSLKELEVQSCKKVKVVFAKNDTEEIPTKLNNLTLGNLSELTLLWEKNFQGILKFQNLQQISVNDCKNIQTLFPDILAENLTMLEKLEVKSCDGLREIVGKEDVTTCSGKKFSFPHLTSIHLDTLPELTYFYHDIFTVEFPVLNDLYVTECPNLELFQGADPEREAASTSTSINRQPLIPNLKAISILKELSLDWRHISMLMLGQHFEDLKYLNKSSLFFNFDKSKKPTLTLEILEMMPNLQDISLGLINSLEIFLTTHNRKQGILRQLKILTLYKVFELQYINLEDSLLNTVCEKLEVLNVLNCLDLNMLFHSPSVLSFSCMKELKIGYCSGLRYLFKCSMAKVLTCLEEISIMECHSIIEIVAKEQDGTTSQGVKFEWLRCIILSSLPSLECFCSGNGSMMLPSLIQVSIWQCPKVEVFSLGEINAELFRGIKTSSDSNDQLVFYNDLNASVKRVFLLQVRISSK